MAVRKVGLVQLKTRGEATLAEIERLVGEAMGAAVPR
jgi:hypothetical protein